MKKAVVWLSLALLGGAGCSTSEARRFERVSALEGAAAASPFRGAVHAGANGSAYYASGSAKVTFPLYCHEARSTIAIGEAAEGGTCGRYLNIESQRPDLLMIDLPGPEGASSRSVPLKAGWNEVVLDVGIAGPRRVSIGSASGQPMVLSRPIHFRRAPATERDLIFLISADTLAASHLGLYGYGRPTTPRIESFARDAVVFLNAQAPSTWTVSSHMSLFTSLLEDGHRVRVKKEYRQDAGDPFRMTRKTIGPLSPAIPTLIERLADCYVTLSFNGGGNVSTEFGFHRGFDCYRSFPGDMKDPRAASRLFDRALAHLDGIPLPSSFYFLHTYHVHTPYQPLPEDLARVGQAPSIIRFDLESDLGGLRGAYKPFPAEAVKDIVSLYDAEIAAFDAAFGAFIDGLKSRGLYDGATIILLSDHGEEFLEHGSWVHASDLYAEQLRIPLLIKFPRQAYGGRAVRASVSLVDVLPTLLADRRIAPPAGLRGRSLLPLVRDPGKDNGSVLASLFVSKPEAFLPGKIAVMRRPWKLVYSQPYPPEALAFFRFPGPPVESWELFDLERDPGERRNVLGSRRSDPAVRAMIMDALDAIRRTTAAFTPPAEPAGSSPSQDLMDQLRSLGYI
jgi:predicted AlkP superfamily pyrophosphatase or phosphodiesterase